MWKSILLLLCITYVHGAEKVNKQIINKNVERSIDLTSQLVKISSVITIENAGKESVQNYLIVVESPVNGNLSIITVKDALKEDVKFKPAEIEGRKDLTAYNVILKQPLDSGRATVITVETIFTKSLVPHPTSILQKEKQLVRYFGNAYLYSPYNTKKQTTNVALSSRSIENYTKLKPSSQSDSTITYGPFQDIQSYSNEEIVVHYENNAPFLTVSRLERNIEISHWGNIAIEENIEIHHTGAKLKGPFSRYDYQRDSGSAHSIKSYRTILPAAAHSIYYRDSNGNISTSNVKTRNEWTELELKPRFPLFGGWQSSYTLGYSVPSYQYLYKNKLGEYVLNMRLIDHVFDDMHVEELETSIVLPVGVSNIRVKTPYETKRLDDGVTYKYLDSIGRTIIKLRKNNLVEQHIQDFEIKYEWKFTLLFHEPLLLTLAMFVLFVFAIIYVRLDFSLKKTEHQKKE
ncbi:unnamed protein product [Brassicogethes aeneus]|uniref:Dolichyl-diphosphooligosaccharide--protein glycosyltransferase subunit 1 n=1 Tax=Brassicogethes aeneus TaxID=1431903 RepID=A0A9P0B9J6_BRAAE|nr:unnamed protein product [Brassicogethes aeneus]